MAKAGLETFIFFLVSRNSHPDMCLVQNFLASRLKSHWKGSLTQTLSSTLTSRNAPLLETVRGKVEEDTDSSRTSNESEGHGVGFLMLR